MTTCLGSTFLFIPASVYLLQPFMYAHLSIYTYIYIRIHICTYIYINTYMCIYIDMHVYINIHAYSTNPLQWFFNRSSSSESTDSLLIEKMASLFAIALVYMYMFVYELWAASRERICKSHCMCVSCSVFDQVVNAVRHCVQSRDFWDSILIGLICSSRWSVISYAPTCVYVYVSCL